MRKLLGLLLLPLGATAWLMAAGPSSADHGGPHVTVTAYNTQVCYDVDQGEDVKVDVTLGTKSYGKDDVQVRRLVMLCETSTIDTFPIPDGPFLHIANNPPPLQLTSIFACYTLLHGENPGDSMMLKTPSFGTDKVVVGKSNLMCESAKKHVTNPGGGVTTYGAASDRILQCFQLADGDNPNLAVDIANNNFGSDVLITGNGIEMCEMGVKYRKINGQTEVTGAATGVLFECFDVADWADDENKPVVLETKNFGRDPVVVRKAAQICQVAEKTGYSIPPVITSKP